MRYDRIHKLLQNFIQKKFFYYQSPFMKVRINNLSGSLHYDLLIILTLRQYICPPFSSFFFFSPFWFTVQNIAVTGLIHIWNIVDFITDFWFSFTII